MKTIYFTGKKYIIGLFLIVLFILSAKISEAAYLTNAQCAAQGGRCNWVSNICSSDETLVGLCEGGAFSQGACCKPNTTPSPTPSPTPISTADTSGSLVPCTNNCTLCDIIVGLNRIFKYLGTLLVIVAILFIIIAGIAYMVSGGSKNLTEWAKKALMYALVGFVIYLASWMIVGSILSAMGYNRTGWSTFDCESGS